MLGATKPQRIRTTKPDLSLLTDFLPTTRREMELRHWTECDIILFSGDAYVDHPSFGAAVIGRTLEHLGYRVAIVPQPDWHGDFRDFTKLGRPRLFFSVAPGCMDSMVNKYTAARRLRSEDAYSPDGRHDMRPEYPTIVYTQILHRLFPDVPVVIGGIEASMRRLTHYDYWQDRLRPSILVDSGADVLVYGMGEKPMAALCKRLEGQELPISRATFRRCLLSRPVRQTVMLCEESEIPGGRSEKDIVLNSHEACLADRRLYAANFKPIEQESNRLQPTRIIQQVGHQYLVVTPPYAPLSTAEIDQSFDLPYTRLPHPKYKGKRIPAYEMIKFSVNIHRGCFGGCAFCTISAHQGKFIMSRSKESIVREVKQIVSMPDFHGTLSDLGGPSANMYAMGGRDLRLCAQCSRPSCIHPAVCNNLNTDHGPLLELYRAVDAIPGVRHSFIGSGVRYDLLLHRTGRPDVDARTDAYTRELILRHVSGRLKVAPEHTSDAVLRLMRKPSFKLFYEFKRRFDSICREAGLRQQIIPYFISSHPGCTEERMAELAAETKRLDFHLEQVQDFTPTPMTVSTVCWASGYHPYTMERIFSARSQQEKQRQRMFFFWYKPEERARIVSELRRLNRPDLLSRLYGHAEPKEHARRPPSPAPRPQKAARRAETRNAGKKHRR